MKKLFCSVTILLLCTVVLSSGTIDVNLNQPQNNSFLNYNTTLSFIFNVTGNYSQYNCSIYTNMTGSFINHSLNEAVQNNTYTEFILDDFQDAGFIWNVFCQNETESNWSIANYTFVVDTILPVPSNNQSYPPSPVVYNSSETYQFNTTWDDLYLSTVVISHNFTGSLIQYNISGNDSNSVFYYNYPSIAAGSYIWRMAANDSAGNTNESQNFTFWVERENSSINLTLNSSMTNFSINESNSVNITASLLAGDQYLAVYCNGSLINNGTGVLENITVFDVPGTYNITATYYLSQNFTMSNITLWVEVNDTLPDIYNLANASVNYSEYRVTWNTTQITNCTINYGTATEIYSDSVRNSSLMMVHNVSLTNLVMNTTYYYKVYCTDYNSNTINTAEYNFTTEYSDIISPNWSYSVSYPDSGQTYNSSQIYQFNISWNDNINLSRVWIVHNFTSILTDYDMTGNVSNTYYYNYTLPAGIFIWAMYANDTSGNLNHTGNYSYTVNRASSNVSLFLNGTSADYSINQTHTVNITAIRLVGEGNLTLLINNTVYNNTNTNITNIKQFDNKGSYYITVLHNITQNYTLSSQTFVLLVNDSIPPNITIGSPLNDSVYSTLNLTITTNELCTCYYKLDEGTYNALSSSDSLTHTYTISPSEGAHNITFNCTDGHFYSSAIAGNITFDQTPPEINITYPGQSVAFESLEFDLNYSIYDTYLDKSWCEVNYNTTKIALNSSINNQTILVRYPGKQIVIVYANDTAGNIYSITRSFYINSTLNISRWAEELNAALADLGSVEVFNMSGQNLSQEISIYQDLTFELNFTEIIVNIINFSAYDTVWNSLFQGFDDNTEFVSTIQTNLGTYPTDYVYITNFSKFYNYSDTYYAKIRLPNNRSNYDYIYYCDDDELESCDAITSIDCSDYGESSSIGCYNNTGDYVYVYVPHLSAVFGDNDTVAPEITITSPENNTILNSSYVLLGFSTNEYATCWYTIDFGTLDNLGNDNSFSLYLNMTQNNPYNISIYCNDSHQNPHNKTINITVSDNVLNSFSVSSSSTTTGITLSWTTDEPTNYSATLDSSTQSSASKTLSHSITFANLSEGTEYTYNIYSCDNVGNCINVPGEATTDTESDDDSTPTTGRTGTGGPPQSTKITAIWQDLSAGEHTMFVSSDNIAIIQVVFSIINPIEGSVSLTVEAVNSIPDFMQALPSTRYQYTRISRQGITDEEVSSIVLKFKVSKSWATNYSIDPFSITLYRYNNGWNRLETALTTSDSKYYYYESSTPGFSYFGIGGEEQEQTSQPSGPPAEEDVAPITGEVTQETTDTGSGEQDNQDEKKEVSPLNFIFPISLLLVVSVIIVFLIYQHRYSVVTDPELVDLRKYVQKCEEEGLPFDKIRATLTKAGWKPTIVDLVLHDVHLPHDEMEKLVRYIHYSINQKISENQIKENLKRAGWQEEIISEAFGYVK
ncbi:PGF-pre-PGF domain-containing protein [Candidatus Woesearchaeota archaeon]|nr:PGF-pre-PGF domain-containing protein [Candidatus Woesearchaeota archaeon]